MEAVKGGETDVSIYFRLRDSTTGLAKTGLAHNSSGASCYYTRNRGTATQVTLVTRSSADAAHTDGGFVEVQGTNAKGLYRLDLPDAAVAAGSRTVNVSIEFDNTIEETKEIFLGEIAADVESWNGTAVPAEDTAGYPKVTIKNGTGTGEVSLNQGVADANTVQIDNGAGAAANLKLQYDGENGLDGSTFPAQQSQVATADEVNAALVSAHGAGSWTTASTVGLSTLTAEQVNAQVLDVLNVDTFAELSSVPAANATITQMLRLLYASVKNKATQTSSTFTLRNDADDGSIATATVTDSGGTFTRNKLS